MPIALLLKTTGEVIPLELTNNNDHEIIRESVGGWFDCVRNHDRRIVGYVHDEGLLLDMEPNYLASALFMREIRGNVVVVNGYNEDGEYDGESYDLPTEFVLFLATNFTEKVAEAYNMATVTAMALEYCDANNLATAEELEQLLKEINAYVDDPNRTKEQGSAIDDKVNALSERANEKLLGEATNTLFDEIDEFLENGGK